MVVFVEVSGAIEGIYAHHWSVRKILMLGESVNYPYECSGYYCRRAEHAKFSGGKQCGFYCGSRGSGIAKGHTRGRTRVSLMMSGASAGVWGDWGLNCRRLGRPEDSCTPVSVSGLGRLGPLGLHVTSPCGRRFLTAWLLWGGFFHGSSGLQAQAFHWTRQKLNGLFASAILCC